MCFLLDVKDDRSLMGGYRLLDFWFVSVLENRHAVSFMVGSFLVTYDKVTHKLEFDWCVD